MQNTRSTGSYGWVLYQREKSFFQAQVCTFVQCLRFFAVQRGESGTEEKMNENKARSRLDQRRAPIYEALEQFRQMRVVPFDVPGHKRGRGNPELTAFLGQQCVGVDVNSMKPLDNLCHPVSVIREAEELAADAFGAAHAFLMVGGTTSSVQSMVLTASSGAMRSFYPATCTAAC